MMKDFRRYPVTWLLLLVTVGVFLTMQVLYFGAATSGEALFRFGAMYGAYVEVYPSQLWRLITPIFIHIGWEHFLFNTMTAYFLGRLCEDLWGHYKYLVIYILSGVMGNIFAMCFNPNVLTAGASTSIFGLFSAIAIVGYFSSNPFLRQLGNNYRMLIVINLVFNLFTPSISIVGHLGGILGGVLCAIFVPTLLDKKLFHTWQVTLAIIAYLVIAVGMVLLFIL